MNKCSAIIVTRNRCSEVCDAIASALNQTICDDVVVVVDASEDDTVETIRERFPSVRLIVNEGRKGVSFCRNRAIQEARHEYVLQIDDDALLTEPEIAAKTMAFFTDDRIAVVAIPYINVNQSTEVHHQSPDSSTPHVAYTYTGTAVMLRRSVFLEMKGYSLELEHWGEERDYALRLLNAGYLVIYGDAPPVHHLTSASRDMLYQNIYLYRNQLFFNFLRAPKRYLPVLFGWAMLWSLKNAIRTGTFQLACRGLWMGVQACWAYRDVRDAMRVSRYRLALDLRKSGGLPLSTVLARIETDV